MAVWPATSRDSLRIPGHIANQLAGLALRAAHTEAFPLLSNHNRVSRPPERLRAHAVRLREVESVADLRHPRGSLALISTHWSMIHDPAKFVLRYAPAIRDYLKVLLPPSADIDEALQELLVGVFERGFAPERIRGRFRDYLIAIVRYTARNFLRRKGPLLLSDEQVQLLPAPEAASSEDTEWLSGWRQCLLTRAWEMLEIRQRQVPNNWYYSALRLTMDHPQADSKTLAAQVPVDPPLTSVAFRKQLSRARAAFARALLSEVERTLETPSLEDSLEELAEVGLLEYVRPYIHCPGSRRKRLGKSRKDCPNPESHPE